MTCILYSVQIISVVFVIFLNIGRAQRVLYTACDFSQNILEVPHETTHCAHNFLGRLTIIIGPKCKPQQRQRQRQLPMTAMLAMMLVLKALVDTSGLSAGQIIYDEKNYVPRRSSSIHYILGNEMAVHTTTAADIQVQRALRGCPTMRVVVDRFQQLQHVFRLGADAHQIIDEPNAGGASVVSEALSAEYMCRRFNAIGIVTEMQIPYFSPHWKKVDYLTTIYGEMVGVSVTRAMGYPSPDAFTEEDAIRLCRKKLNGLVVARAGIVPSVGYCRSILHCWCQTQQIADLMSASFKQFIAESDEEARASFDNIVVLLTVAGNTPEIFTESFECLI